MSDLSKEDKLLLEQAFADVRPINLASHLHTNSQPPPKLVRHQRTKSPKNQPNLDSEHEPETRVINSLPTGHVSWFHPSLRPQDIKKLRQGNYPGHYELDLHGLTQDNAVKALLSFLNTHRNQGTRLIKVIHGKGYNSQTGPILKHCVLEVLTDYPRILGICSALPKDGGTGAVYVLFKKAFNPED